MKQIFSLFTLFCFVFIGAGLSGCSDDATQEFPNPGDGASAKLTLEPTVGVSTAELKLTTSKVQEYAFLTTTDMAAPAPAAAVIFGTGTKVAATEGENVIALKGLEGDTDYMIYVTTKANEKFGEVLSQKIHTAKYTEFVTILETGFHSVKFHVEVQPGDTISWGFTNRDNYLGLKQQFMYVDADFISGNPESRLLLTESTTVNFTGWDEENWETGEITKLEPLPGEALQLVLGKVKLGVNSWGEVGYVAEFDYEKYQSGLGGGGGFDPLNKRPLQGPPTPTIPEEECWKTPYHASIAIATKAPDVLDAHVDVKVVEETTRTVKLRLSPDIAKIAEFGYTYIDMATWETVIKTLGSVESAHAWAFGMGMLHSDGPVEFEVKNLQPGITYRLIILGYVDAERTLQSVDYFDFKAKEATKPAPKIFVRGIPAPKGEVEQPSAVWFNVKCLSNDAVIVKYLCNTTREWVTTHNTGSSYDNMMTQYGQELTGKEVAAVNSADGFNIKFDNLWEDTSMRLVVCGYNEEEVCNNPETDPDGLADYKTICFPDAPRVESALFEQLQGDWTATVTCYKTEYNQTTGDQYWDLKEPEKIKVVISDVPKYPATCPEEAYAAYEGKTKAEVDAIYEDFKKASVRYASKVRGQNRLVCQGFDLKNDTYGAYKAPIELFYDTNYSCYSSEDIYFDYGAKWYLQINADGSISVPIDLKTMAPMTSWYYDAYYMIALAERDFANQLTEFKTTISADHNTIEVLPTVMPDKLGEEQTYMPSVATVSSEGARPCVKCKSIVLTKGWTEPAPKPSVRAKARTAAAQGAMVPSTTPFKLTPAHHKTRLGSSDNANVEYKKVTVEQMFYNPTANLEKFVNKRK
ncbi:MAG: hypothetical protein RRZ83_06380 [Alistipes sp.]